MLCGERTEELFHQEYSAHGGAQYPGSSQIPRIAGIERGLWKSPRQGPGGSGMTAERGRFHVAL